MLSSDLRGQVEDVFHVPAPLAFEEDQRLVHVLGDQHEVHFPFYELHKLFESVPWLCSRS